MSDRNIYTRANGRMEELREQSFGNDPESVLQKLIAQHPDLLSGEQLSPEIPLRWILITREQGIAEGAGAGNRWSVAHLLIDQDARPTLVEVKLRRNPEIRRAVVGQLLEYAAHARRSWGADDLRRTFEAQPDWEDTLRALLEGGDEPDPDEFWRSVKTNLRASSLRLLFVADTIPGPLAQVVAFLNEQMRDVDALAVEIKRYVGGGRETFVPRVIGRSVTPRSAGTGPTLDGIVARFPGGPVRSAAQRLIDRARAAGATFEPGSHGFSIRGTCALASARHRGLSLPLRDRLGTHAPLLLRCGHLQRLRPAGAGDAERAAPPLRRPVRCRSACARRVEHGRRRLVCRTGRRGEAHRRAGGACRTGARRPHGSEASERRGELGGT